MTVVVIGAKEHTVAVKQGLQAIADMLDNMDEGETHIMLTELNGSPVLIHRDMVDLVTT